MTHHDLFLPVFHLVPLVPSQHPSLQANGNIAPCFSTAPVRTGCLGGAGAVSQNGLPLLDVLSLSSFDRPPYGDTHARTALLIQPLLRMIQVKIILPPHLKNPKTYPPFPQRKQAKTRSGHCIRRGRDLTAHRAPRRARSGLSTPLTSLQGGHSVLTIYKLMCK